LTDFQYRWKNKKIRWLRTFQSYRNKTSDELEEEELERLEDPEYSSQWVNPEADSILTEVVPLGGVPTSDDDESGDAEEEGEEGGDGWEEEFDDWV